MTMNAPPRWGAGLQMLTQAIFLHFFVSFEKRGQRGMEIVQLYAQLPRF